VTLASGSFTVCLVKIATPEQQQEWVRIYKAAAIALEEQRWRELEALTPEKALWLSETLLSMPVTVPPRESSGLVEQQALFARLRRR
jgi:hypothetical protein